MQINHTNNQPQFGALLKNRQARKYIRTLPTIDQVIVFKLGIKHQRVHVDAKATTTKDFFGNERLKITVDDTVFKEGFFDGPIKTLTKALDYAKKVSMNNKTYNF